MLSVIKNNIYPAIALVTIPVGYYIGTELRERSDAKKEVPAMTEQDIEKLKQQLEALREEPMIKQTHMNRPLYDRVRQDLFEEKKKSSLRIPSITTICLLQIQAFMVQLLSNLPRISGDEKPCTLFQYFTFSTRSIARWILLSVSIILDNIARLLNVESEIRDIITEDDDGYYSQKSDQCTKRNSSTTNESGTSEPTTPNKRSSGHSMVSPSSPIHSPTPNFVLYPAPTTRSVNSPVLAPSRVNHTNRARSSSFNNTTDKQLGQQLRRSPGRREITVHNAILPIQRKHHHHHHHQSDKKANSVTSRSSSESSTGRPRMQKTMSLSTAQQYQQQQHHHNEVNK
ncbi:hypothetical protein MFLAVUS_008472 [Mucor flavus]|uniref:Uncharacterized protein n=1 Tax=Mucor flavus TaxID=439312 RepID=A0ABP9Z779_9FUNG